MVGSPVHEPSGSLIGSEEEDLLLSVQVNDRSLDTGRLSRKKKVGDGVDVSLEAKSRVGSEGGKDRSLGSSAKEKGQKEKSARQLGFSSSEREKVEGEGEGGKERSTHPSGISLFLRAWVEARA